MGIILDLYREIFNYLLPDSPKASQNSKGKYQMTKNVTTCKANFGNSQTIVNSIIQNIWSKKIVFEKKYIKLLPLAIQSRFSV